MQKLDPTADGEAHRLMVRLPAWLKSLLFKAVPERDRSEFVREAIAEKLKKPKKRNGKA